MLQYNCKMIACTIIERSDSTTWIIPAGDTVLRVDASELDRAFDLLNVIRVDGEERADANKYANKSKASSKAKALSKKGSWITVNGSHVLVDNKGNAVAGAEGNLPPVKTKTAYIETKTPAKSKVVKKDKQLATNGANTLAVKDWKNEKVRLHHVKKHVKDKKEYPDEATYLATATKLAEMPVGGDILGYTRSDGQSFVRYNKKTNEYVIAKVGGSGGIITLYKPTLGERYYLKHKKDDLEKR